MKLTALTVVLAAALLLGGAFRAEKTPTPQGDRLARLGLRYQQLARATGDPAYFTRSERALRRAGQTGADPTVVTTGLATLAGTRHRFGTSLALARQAIRLDSENASAYGALGDALVELGRYREAFAAYDQMVLLSPSVASFARVAQARELLGRRDRALEALRLALELDASPPEQRAWTLVRIGKLRQDSGRLAEAKVAYRAALRVQARYPHARAGLALVAADRRRYGQAADALRGVLRDLPTTEYAVDWGDALARVGRTREAEQAYGLASRLERRLAAHGVRTELQSALFDLDHDRNLPDALARARAGRRLRPGIEGEHVLAWALYKNGRCAEGRRHSVRALRLGTPDLDALYHRSLIELCLGNERAARRFLERVRALNPYYLLAPPSAAWIGAT